jgi:phosphoribosylaminoimidazolecarboxamide formyltransferase/IMP cyclohydrolase
VTTIPVRRALVSVWDKTGVVDLARRLCAAGVEIVSSGGTAEALRRAGVAVTDVASVTGSPEILGGRVKTLHPAIHGAILADMGNEQHVADLAAQGIAPFELVVSNLYPFERTVADPEVKAGDAVEQIDIGGPAMVRAAAKNHAWVGVVTSPDQYDAVAAAVEAGGLDDEMRRELAATAFFHTAAYDAAIVAWLERDELLPPHLVVALQRAAALRYGENPHQPAAIYAEVGSDPWWRRARLLQGKEMSFNNYADAEAAWRLACTFADPVSVVVKHTNPCGVARGDSAASAFVRAWDCDPLSAFGGVIALNRTVDEAAASAIAGHFAEVVVAPAVAPEAEAVLARKSGLRVLVANPPGDGDLDARRVEAGLLVQARDRVLLVHPPGELPPGWRVVAGPEPVPATLADLELAWTVAAHTKSNAVVIAAGGMAIGIGAGDQSRVGAAERAIVRARLAERGERAAAASDAFLPFRDTLDALAKAGVVALVEPGGSKRDDEVVAAAQEWAMTLVFTGDRHFRH